LFDIWVGIKGLTSLGAFDIFSSP